MKKHISIILFLAAGLTFAQEGAGQKFDELLGYKNVVVTKVEPDGIRIRHDDGTKKLKLEDLPADIRAKFGLNEAAAKDYREAAKIQEQEAAKAEQAELQKAVELQRASYLKFTVKGSIKQVFPNGLVLTKVFALGPQMVEKRTPYEVQVDGPTALAPNKPVKMETRYKIEKVPEGRYFNPNTFVFIKCDTSKLNDSSTLDFQTECFEMAGVRYRNNPIEAFSIDSADAGKQMGIQIE